MILTFDLGTTRLKVAVFTTAGQLKGQVAIRHTDYRSRDAAGDELRWQSANDWWHYCIEATRRLMDDTGLGPADIEGCSLSGRAGAGVFVDEAANVLIDPWSDNRHTDHLRKVLGERDRRETAMYGATLLSKLLWAREHRPDLVERTRHLLYAKDFILYRLTGRAVTDPSSGPDALAWDSSLLAAWDVPEALLPRPALPWTIAGEITESAAREIKLNAGTPVATGAHDGICANVGAGAIEPGQYAITLGTHAVVRAVAADPPPGAFRFYGFPPDKHIIGGNAFMAGRALDWFIDNWFDAPEENRQQLFAELDARARGIAPGANGVLFLPFLSGRLAPERRPGARAAFHGLATGTTRDDMYRAVVEGASYAIAAVFEQIETWTGKPLSVGVTGSGANSRAWTQILSDLLQQPLGLTDGASEGRGAAAFCAVALGRYATLAEAVSRMVRVSHEIQPDETAISLYRPLFDRWQRFADATRVLDS